MKCLAQYFSCNTHKIIYYKAEIFVTSNVLELEFPQEVTVGNLLVPYPMSWATFKQEENRVPI